jgi:NADH-quinone oxidoreductase subunit M
MSRLHFPWIEAAIAVPLIGALMVGRVRDVELGFRGCVVVCAITLLLATGGWGDHAWTHATVAHDAWDGLAFATGVNLLAIDELSAPLMPLTALVYLLTTVVTMRAKLRQLSFAGTLVSEAIVLATLSCRMPWGVIVLLTAGVIPPYLELRRRGNSGRVFAIHMVAASAALCLGWAFLGPTADAAPGWACLLLMVGVLIRCGIVPLHCWVTDLFEKASFGTSLMYTTPMLGAYAAVRLVLPVAPAWLLQGIAALSLFTAVYAAAMALVQRESRRFFCFVFLSHSSLILVGLCSQTALGLAGALGVWLAAEISLAGFGLVLRALESRHGRLSLLRFHGVYEHTPELAVCFLLTGLTSVGFPGTFGFLSTELLIDGVVRAFPLVGIAVVIAAMLNGIAVMHAYFRLFAGTRCVTTVPLRIGVGERVAVLMIVALVLGGSIYPQPGISSRHHAAQSILEQTARPPSRAGWQARLHLRERSTRSARPD